MVSLTDHLDMAKDVKMKNVVNVLKFQTLFYFCIQIKCWLSGLKLAKCLLE